MCCLLVIKRVLCCSRWHYTHGHNEKAKKKMNNFQAIIVHRPMTNGSESVMYSEKSESIFVCLFWLQWYVIWLNVAVIWNKFSTNIWHLWSLHSRNFALQWVILLKYRNIFSKQFFYLIKCLKHICQQTKKFADVIIPRGADNTGLYYKHTLF